MPDFVRARPAFSLAAAVLVTLHGAARADDALFYGAHAKATIVALLEGRAFTPEAGCEDLMACTALLARLRDADFAVVEPAERSDRPDLPGYLRVRGKCPALDPARITLAHRTYAATRGFAVYRLDLPGPESRADETLVFRAEHYASLAADAAEEAVLVPGMFVVIGLRGCRVLATARAEDGDWLAKHNAIGDGDHASELLKIGTSYFVLNLSPIAGPGQPKASWWYALELWDLGPRADADRRNRRHVYSFAAAASGSSTEAAKPVPNDAGVDAEKRRRILQVLILQGIAGRPFGAFSR